MEETPHSVKFLCIYSLEVVEKKMVSDILNGNSWWHLKSVDPDQTAPEGAVFLFGIHYFHRHFCEKHWSSHMQCPRGMWYFDISNLSVFDTFIFEFGQAWFSKQVTS